MNNAMPTLSSETVLLGDNVSTFSILIAPHDAVNNELVGVFTSREDAKKALANLPQREDCDYAIICVDGIVKA